MKNLKSTNLQLIGFFGTKKPIICKIVDSVHSSVNYILETVPYFDVILLSLNKFLTAVHVLTDFLNRQPGLYTSILQITARKRNTIYCSIK